ncbi:MAG: tRNA (adenosine(37)-N6)-threonylcarbamoyltransferase complex ATPase subunit type 1 TsaE [Bacteroidota bacterium]
MHNLDQQVSTEVKSYQCSSLADLPAAAADMIALLPNNRVFLLVGEMGAGKTTLIKSLCSALGVTDTVNSPTFTLVNEYMDGHGEPVYHFDLYRLEKESEALDFGIEDYLCSGHYCFIEWPEKASRLMPEDAARITITVNNQERNITLSV